jgi:hypothetical protein
LSLGFLDAKGVSERSNGREVVVVHFIKVRVFTQFRLYIV